MGQKVNPHGLRVGVIKDWDSRWYAREDKVGDLIVEDYNIRKYLKSTLYSAGIAKIEIERDNAKVKISIHCSRPGVIIGKGGSAVDKLKEELKKVTSKEVQINIFEVRRPEVDANIVADSIARQIEGRVSYRRAIKLAVSTAMRVGAEGIKVQISGRVGGAEMARSEMFKEGRTPLHTFRADIDYALAVAHTKVGALGIKVWICNGEVYGKKDLSPNAGLASASAQPQGQGRQSRGDRGPRQDRGDRGPRREYRD